MSQSQVKKRSVSSKNSNAMKLNFQGKSSGKKNSEDPANLRIKKKTTSINYKMK